MKTAMVLMSLVLIAGCGPKRRSQPNVELIQDMFVSPAVKSQDEDPNSMKYPPEGTVPQGHTPYTMPSPDEAAVKLVNPEKASQESILRGQKSYMTYCFPCHGAKGDGKGPIAEKWPTPIPPFINQRARDLKDGYFYHLIVRGRGLMGSYASQVQEKDRWALINFIRHLQSTSPVLPDGGTAQ